MKLRKDEFIIILGFLGCHEWRSMIYTCQYLANMLRRLFLPTIKLFAISRLRNMLHFLDFDHFTRLIRRENGEIGGSIHAQLFLGNHFKSHDIDVFVYGKRPEFSNLHTYLYDKCQRVESILKDFRHSSPNYVYQDDQSMHDVRISDYFRVGHAYKVISVWNYYFLCDTKCECINYCKNFTTIQVVTIEDLEEQNYVPMYKRIQNDIGDFSIVQSCYNGKCYNVRGMIDLFNMQLVCSETFLIRASLFNKFGIEKHVKRVEKYVTRGFKSDSSIQYGSNVRIFSIHGNDWNKSYIALQEIPNFLMKIKNL